MLVGDVLDRTQSEWLWPAGVDRPAYDLLVADMNAAAPASGDTFAVEGKLQGFIPPDSLLEIDSELILTRDVSGLNVTVQDRGWLDSDAADHAAGTKVYVSPKYPRLTLLHALASIIGQLYPWGLYDKATDTTKTYTTREVRPMPAGAKGILSILVMVGGSNERYEKLKVKGKDWLEYSEFDPVRFIMRRGGGEGMPLVISYRRDFTRPTSEADDLTALHIPETLQPYLPMAVAGYVLQSKEIPRVQVEEIRRMLATTGVQVGQVMNIGQQMLRTFQQTYVSAERRRLREQTPTPIEWAGVSV